MGNRWKLVLIAFVMFAAKMFPQATSVISGQVVNLQGIPVPYAPIRVCPQTATGVPCTPLASIYSDPALAVPIPNPTAADQNGFFSIFVGGSVSFYQVQTSPTDTITYSFYANGNQGGGGGGGVIPSPQFTLFYQPTPGTAGTAQGDQYIKTDGAGHLVAKSVLSTYYASQLQTGGENNGIVNCSTAGNAFCVADPGYSTTEEYSFRNMIPLVGNNFTFQDNRPLNQGQSTFYHNWGYALNTTFNFQPAALATNCLTDQPYTGAFTTEYSCNWITFYDSQPGVSLGSSTVPAIGSIQWTVGQGVAVNYNTWGAGIRDSNVSQLVHYGIGDTASYSYIYCKGGARAGSDEGCENADAVGEDISQFRETCTTGCTTGSQAIIGNPISFTNEIGVRCCVIDITQGPIANTITNMVVAGGLDATITSITVGTPITASTAWGTLAGNVQPTSASLSSYPYGSIVTFNVNSSSGSFVANSPMCFASQYHDVIKPTSVTGSGPYTITALVRKPHASGSVVMQGGMCGYGMEIIANTPSGSNPNRYIVDVIGSTSTTNLQVTFFRTAGNSNIPWQANQGNFAPLNILFSQTGTRISSSGTTVYVTGVSSFPGWNHSNVIFSGASDSALNNICTGVTWVTSNLTSFTCTIAGLTGTHTATSVTIHLANQLGTANLNAINLWPMAEVLDVQDYNATTCTALHLAPACIDGTLALEPNVVPFNTGDTLTITNDYAGEFFGHKSNLSAQNPWSLFYGLHVGVIGTGANGGASGLIGNAIIQIGNSQPDNSYTDNGGTLSAPNAFVMVGAYYDFFIIGEGPAQGRALFNILPTSAQKTNPNYTYNLLSSANNSGTTTDTITPFLGDRALAASGQLSLGGVNANVNFTSSVGGMNSTDKITFITVGTPAVASVSPGPGTGTLADSTSFCYQVYASNFTGSTPVSAEFCGTSGSTGGANSMLVKWNRLAGATLNYFVCGRTTGTELKMATLSATTLAWVDDGSVTPSGGCPTSNTTRGYVDQAAKVGFNSSTTAFEVSLTAPTAIGASYIELFPSTATAGQLVDIANSTTTVAGDITTFSNTTGRIQDSGTLLSSLTIVNNSVSSATGGSGTGTVTCLTASCTNVSGSYSVVGGTFSTGNLLVLVWPTTTTAYKCVVSQNGGVAAYGIGHSVATATGMTITAGISVTGVTVSFDYLCSKY